MSTLVADFLKLGAVVGFCVLCYFLYEGHLEAEHRREAERHKAELDQQIRLREEDEKRNAELKVKEERRAQAKVAHEAALKEAQEARNRMQQEARQAKLQEEAMARARGQVAKQAAKEAEAETRRNQVANAQERLATVRREKFLSESRKVELNRMLIATNNRIEGARKIASEADGKAKEYSATGSSKSTGDMSGTSAVPVQDLPPEVVPPNSTIQGGNRGISSIRTDNSELVAKERARSDAARREIVQMQALASKTQTELSSVERRLGELGGEESALETYLRDRGEDPAKVTWKGVVQSRSESNGDNRVVLKDGTVIIAEKAVDFGTQYSIKTIDGKYIAVDKDKVASIPTGLLPQK